MLHPQSVAAVHVDGVELVADTRELCSDSSVLVLPDRLSEPALRRALEAAAAGVPIVYVAVGTADTAVDPRPPGARVRIPAADIPGIYLIIDAAVTTRMRASHGAWRVRQLHVPEARTLLVPPSRFVRVEGAQTLLYPDPPLGTAAAEAAGVAHCRLLTPGTLNLVRASKPIVVGLSFSIPEHPANAGWEGPHLQDLQVQLARSLVLAGHTVVTAGLVEIGQVVSPLYPIAVTHGSAGSVVQVHPEVSGGADRDLLAELEGEFACRLLLQALARVGKTLKRGRQPVSQPHAPPPVAPGPPAARPGGVPAA